MILFCLKKNKFWMVQLIIFNLIFINIIKNINFNFFVGLSYEFGIDLISYGLIILRIWICTLMLMARELIFTKSNFSRIFLVNVLLLLLFLILSFTRFNLLIFYIFFESSLIPTVILVIAWGYQPERLQARIYLLFYTLLVSLPILLGILYLYNRVGSINFYLLINNLYELDLFYFCIVLAFLVKIPIFLVHLWLPKAHVEAPVSGSIILAGIILKLGGYGLLRVIPFLQKLNNKFGYIWVSIRLVGGVLVSLICLRQTDMKILVAYSSVVHIGVVLSGIITLFCWGLCGSYSLMIAHGLCSSGLFCLVNINYERLGRRRLLINRGIIRLIPSLTLWWFLLCISNIAAPPSLNLLGEIMLLNRIVGWSWYTMYILIFISFFRAAYSLYLFSYSQHGKINIGVFLIINGNIREYILLFLHWFPLNLLIIKREICTIWLCLSSLIKILICGVNDIVIS